LILLHDREAIIRFYLERIVIESDDCARDFRSVLELQLIGWRGAHYEQRSAENGQRSSAHQKSSSEPHACEYGASARWRQVPVPREC